MPWAPRRSRCTCRPTSLAGGRGGRRAGRGRLHLVDAARPPARLRAEPARGRDRRSDAGRSTRPRRAIRGRRGALLAGRRSALGRVARRGGWRRIRRPARSSAPARSLLAARRCLFACGCCAGRPRHVVAGHGWRPVSRLGMRNATLPARPQRAVDGGHRVGDVHPDRRRRVSPRRRAGDATIRNPAPAATQLIVETAAAGRPRSRTPRDGREALNLVRPRSSRRRSSRSACCPGDDASCLNLYAADAIRGSWRRGTRSSRRAVRLPGARSPRPTPSARTRGCCCSAPSRTARFR